MVAIIDLLHPVWRTWHCASWKRVRKYIQSNNIFLKLFLLLTILHIFNLVLIKKVHGQMDGRTDNFLERIETPCYAELLMGTMAVKAPSKLRTILISSKLKEEYALWKPSGSLCSVQVSSWTWQVPTRPWIEHSWGLPLSIGVQPRDLHIKAKTPMAMIWTTTKGSLKRVTETIFFDKYFMKLSNNIVYLCTLNQSVFLSCIPTIVEYKRE